MDTGGLDTPAPPPPGSSANLAFQLVRKEYFNVLFWSILVSSKRHVEDSAWFLCIDRYHELHVKAQANLFLSGRLLKAT